MTFDNIHRLLRWIVNMEFVTDCNPRPLGNHDLTATGGRQPPQDVEDIWCTFYAINNLLLQSLSPRELDIIIRLYRWDGPTDKEIGRCWKCSRWSVWRTKRDVIDRLEKVFENVGLISHRYESPKYLIEEVIRELEGK